MQNQIQIQIEMQIEMQIQMQMQMQMQMQTQMQNKKKYKDYNKATHYGSICTMLTISSAGRSVSEWPKYKYEWPKLKPPTPSLYFSNDWMQEMPERRICDLIYCLLVTEWYIVRWLLNNILFVGYWMIYCLLATEWYIVFWLLKYCMLKYCDGLLLNII